MLRGQATSRASAAASLPREPLETLTAAESDTLEAICARLIPTDPNGPGAAEARAAHYIDRALGGALQSSRQAYASGLAALDRYASASRGTAFSKLSPIDQDLVLQDVASGAATGFPNGPVAFFNLVRAHTIEGTFCDPYYGGNAGFVGWDLVGYPGVRTVVTAEEQRTGIALKPNHKSAYDYAMFTKASARLETSPAADHDGG
jgi:gluconate 2-dehydrogenase gamma chain